MIDREWERWAEHELPRIPKTVACDWCEPGKPCSVCNGTGQRSACKDCGESAATCPEGRCRDCDHAHVVTTSSCRECHRWIWDEAYGGPIPDQHASTCSLRAVDNFTPHTMADYLATRRAVNGWAPGGAA